MTVRAIDHAAIPVADLEAMLAFYRSLGFTVDESHAPHVFAVRCGEHKINFHSPELWQSGRFTLRGPTAQPGCGDFCFVWGDDQSALDQRLDAADARVIEGPVPRVGGRGAQGSSTYVRDPDGNLLEFIIYPD